MDPKKQLELIRRGAVEIISEKDLLDKLHKSQKENKPLKIKAGFDPSAPDIHIGHTVLLKKLRDFQDAGHIVYFLIGDFTGRIGDPTGQSVIRKQLTKAEVMENAKTYEKQVFKVLDKEKTKVVFNSQWFDKMSPVDMLKLASHSTVAQMLVRDDFSKRYKEQKPISMIEFMYPLLQGYDSVVLEADIELGGTDQKFNLLIGRDLQIAYGQAPQVVITMPLLVGTDGVNKMSKSLNNYISINDPAKVIFGKVMSISDDTMFTYYELLTNKDLQQIKNMHPMEAKKNLAKNIIQQYYDKTAAEEADKDFEKRIQKGDHFTDLPAKEIKMGETGLTGGKLSLSLLLCDMESLVKSRSEFRRLIDSSSIIVNGEKIKDIDYGLELDKEYCIKIGRLRFLKIRLKK
ncbi:MAG: tyrosine--tRNA ligase [Candidatus Omnitrophica bacterium CG12_big_fil_rev_8_21_14_0_65_43_15]|uniref:Tyrosine--tRNA ligase n=1 Tax=Candidatus Taenaricola geysiri TaxID=1974752 RepID=A0A2J0LI20_9BACT|nr:MAG: tyrosine--tRNA ligase [Candidatus Omnitrophica bacterium CG10_big_fil_rev_8_21_14_0_10_43_8]PIW66514.1 MAG: tyrosine--tRNA ligase [Candidatus Omnitrophica bacterium CG12_big_fil_rev_8_21_14_0_65_43_15]PIW79974.1 MAG: tyrosine--tRNA ligase [Candidatus Omnitrophica bacterium CG_4_8_14_3_um_filter_43_15]PIY83911.1 MAG: tyrosine--tRNA ligase [Candidatus Omnitrophica bacterium CG_4_10_14_0_8_um_filter_43_18]PJC46740.1 MAG: tyrosine--tRNA ligase [Candidatus Omnitrophica bacterium CG_4_9_14_0_